MNLASRRTSPSSRCYDRGGVTGCYTTGWQDHVELEHWVEVGLRHRGPHFQDRIQRLFKRHARAMPGFLGEGYDVLTSDGELHLYTLCTTGAPTWNLRRRGDYATRLQCNLYTVMGRFQG